MIYYCDGAGWNGKVSKYCVCREDGKHWIYRMEYNYTNNETEYMAVIHALLVFATEGDIVLTDSRLVVEQGNGRWKCKSKNLITYMMKVKQLLKERKCTLDYVHRDDNLAGNLLEGDK